MSIPDHTANPDRTPSTEPAVLTARGPDDVLAVVPYRLGFHPADSLVVMALDGPRRRIGFTARLDLPRLAGVAHVARYVVGVLGQHGAEEVLLVAYTTDDGVAGPLVATLEQWLDRAGMRLVDAFRCDGHRWYCYTCADSCCPAEGTPYDLSDHPLVAEQVLRGQVALPDREAVRDRVRPVSGGRAERMHATFGRVEDALGAEYVGSDGRDEFVRGCTRWVRGFVADWLERPRPVAEAEVAGLAVRVAMVPARDVAWSMMTRPTAEQHVDLWGQVLRRVVPPYEPAVACLTSFAAWLDGHGALAWCAVERALEADPSYSWARLIVQSLEQAVPPSVWQPPSLDDVGRFAD